MSFHHLCWYSKLCSFHRWIAGLALGLFFSAASAIEPPAAQLVKDINQAAGAGSEPQALYNLNGTLYFFACKGMLAGDCGLWKSDGSEEGTSFVSAWDRDVEPGHSVRDVTESGGSLYFTQSGGDYWQLYSSDLTSARIRSLSEFNGPDNPVRPLNPKSLTSFDNALYLTGLDLEKDVGTFLWKYANGKLTPVKQLSLRNWEATLIRAGKHLYFTVLNPAVSDGTLELWVIDEGGSGAPRLIRQFPGSYVNLAAAVGDDLYLVVAGSSHSDQLWKSDGTGISEGTRKVADVGYLSVLYNHEGTLYFTRWNGDENDLWKTDGTGEGTVKVKTGGNPAELTSVDNLLYFVTSTNQSPVSSALWRTDGMAEGGATGEAHTVKIKDFGEPGPSDLLAHNGILYFFAHSGLWRSDGSAEGTLAVPSNFGYSSRIVPVSSTLFFANDDGVHGDELWKLPLRPATVSLSNLSAAYNGSPQGANCSTVPAGLATRLAYDGASQAPTAVGNYKVACVVTDPGYSGQSKNTFSIVPATQKITNIQPAGPLPFVSGGGFGLSAMGGASGNAVVFASTTSAVCTVSGTNATMLSAGICRISANQAGNASFQAAAEVIHSVELTAAKTAQTISFAAMGTLAVGNSAPLVASASSGLPVVFSSLTGSVCAVSGQTVIGVSPGTCKIAADQAGDTKYLPAPQVLQSFAVEKTTGITVPKAPSIVLIMPIKKGLSILFVPPTNNGGAKITGYTATCTERGNSGNSTTASRSSAGILSVKKLQSGVAYSCSVHATNSKGNSPESASRVATPR